MTKPTSFGKQDGFISKSSISNGLSWGGITLCALGIIVLVTGILTLCKEIPWHKVIRFPNHDFTDSYRIRVGISSTVLGVVMIGISGILLIQRRKQPLLEEKKLNQHVQNTQEGSDQIKEVKEKENDPIAQPILQEDAAKKVDELKNLFMLDKKSAEEVAEEASALQEGSSLVIDLYDVCIESKPPRYLDALFFIAKIPHANKAASLFRLLEIYLREEIIDSEIVKKIIKEIQKNSVNEEKCYRELINPYAEAQVSHYTQNQQLQQLRNLLTISAVCKFDDRNRWLISIAQICLQVKDWDNLETIVEKIEGNEKEQWMQIVALHYFKIDIDKAITYCCKMSVKLREATINQWLSPLLLEEKNEELLVILHRPLQQCKEIVEKIVMKVVENNLNEKIKKANLGEAYTLYQQFQLFFSYDQHKVLKKLLAECTANLTEDNGRRAEEILNSIKKKCPFEQAGTFAPLLVAAYLAKNQFQKAYAVEMQFRRPYPLENGHDVWINNSKSTLLIAQYYLKTEDNPVEKIQQLSKTGAQTLFAIIIKEFLENPQQELFKKIFSICDAIIYNNRDLLLRISKAYKQVTKIEDIEFFLSRVPLLKHDTYQDRKFRKELLILLDDENIESICQKIDSEKISKEMISVLMDHFLLQIEDGINYALRLIDAVAFDSREFFLNSFFIRISNKEIYKYLFMHFFLANIKEEKREQYHQYLQDPQLVAYVDNIVNEFLTCNKGLFGGYKEDQLQSKVYQECQRCFPNFIGILKACKKKIS